MKLERCVVYDTEKRSDGGPTKFRVDYLIVCQALSSCSCNNFLPSAFPRRSRHCNMLTDMTHLEKAKRRRHRQSDTKVNMVKEKVVYLVSAP